MAVAHPKMSTFSTHRPVVILYSYHIDQPVDFSNHIDSLQVVSTLAASTYDTAQFSLEKSWMGEIPVVGDWVQIDLQQAGTSYSEHIFFGVITQISHSSQAMGFGGSNTQASIKCLDFSHLLNKTSESGKLWGMYFAKDVGETESADAINPLEEMWPPSLSSVVQSLERYQGHSWITQENIMPTCTLMVQMFLEIFVLWGGTLFNTYYLPRSFGDGVSYPIDEFICKRNERRLGPFNERIKFRNWWTNPSRSDGALTPLRHSMAMLLYREGNPSGEDFIRSGAAQREHENSAWRRSYDWYKMFDDLDYFQTWRTPDTLEVMRTTMTGMTASIWQSAVQWSDVGWTELFTSLVEHCEWPRQRFKSQVVKCTNGQEYPRDFLPCISLRPIPHPVYHCDEENMAARNKWSRLTSPTKTEWGVSIEADSYAYENFCTKFLVDVNSVTEMQLARSSETLYNWYSVISDGKVGLKGYTEGMGTFGVGPAMGVITNWRMPIMVEGLKDRYGHQPLELYTKYSWVIPNGEAAANKTVQASELMVESLVLKNYLQYSWNIKNPEYYHGAVAFPIIDINVPRPGDVGYIVGEPQLKPTVGIEGDSSFSSIQFDSALSDYEPKKTHSGLHPHITSTAHALSLYVESVSLNVTKGDGYYTGSVSCTYSRGEWVTIPEKGLQWEAVRSKIADSKRSQDSITATSDKECYFRYVKPSDAGGWRPVYWLPYRGKNMHVQMAMSASLMEGHNPSKYEDDPASAFWTALTFQELVSTRKGGAIRFYGDPSYLRSSTPGTTYRTKTSDTGLLGIGGWVKYQTFDPLTFLEKIKGAPGSVSAADWTFLGGEFSQAPFVGVMNPSDGQFRPELVDELGDIESGD